MKRRSIPYPGTPNPNPPPFWTFAKLLNGAPAASCATPSRKTLGESSPPRPLSLLVFFCDRFVVISMKTTPGNSFVFYFRRWLFLFREISPQMLFPAVAFALCRPPVAKSFFLSPLYLLYSCFRSSRAHDRLCFPFGVVFSLSASRLLDPFECLPRRHPLFKNRSLLVPVTFFSPRQLLKPVSGFPCSLHQSFFHVYSLLGFSLFPFCHR